MISLGTHATAHQSRWAWAYLLAVAGFAIWRRLTVLDIALLALLGWAALSMLWAPDRSILSLTHALALFGIYLFGANTKTDWRHGIVAAFAVIAGYQIYDWRLGWYGNENWNAEFILLSLPIIAWWMREGWRGWVGLALLILGAVVLLRSNSNLHWFIVMAWIWMGLLWLFTHKWWEAVAATVLAVGCGILLIEGTNLEVSVFYRLEIWWNAGHAWAAAFLFGHGLGSFDYVYDTYREAHFVWGDASVMANMPSRFAGAAHNLPVQIAVELGLIGLGLAAFILWHLKVGISWAAIVLGIAGMLCLLGFPEQLPQTGLIIALSLGYVARGYRGHTVRVAVRLYLAGRVESRMENVEDVWDDPDEQPGGPETELGGHPDQPLRSAISETTSTDAIEDRS